MRVSPLECRQPHRLTPDALATGRRLITIEIARADQKTGRARLGLPADDVADAPAKVDQRVERHQHDDLS